MLYESPNKQRLNFLSLVISPYVYILMVNFGIKVGILRLVSAFLVGEIEDLLNV